MAEIDIWEGRRKALHETIKGYHDSLPKKATSPGFTSASTGLSPEEKARELHNLGTLVQCLEKFGKDQFGFFHDGFVTQKQFKLNPSREFPPEHIFSVTLNQIAEDLEVIRRAADQRLSDEMGPTLKREADKLTWNALKPMIDAGILPKYENDSPPTVMTYFQKSASVRIIPYAPVALIGLPFTAPSVRRDYLAIPHEVGHYVYRHGRVKGGQSIPQALGRMLLKLPEPSPRYVYRWKEEIFADVYGCLVGGPVVALSFQDLALQSSRSPLVQTPGEYLYGQFTEDDGVHPTSVLRPYVYAKVLREMGLADLAQEFEDAWTEQISEITEFSSSLEVEEAKAEIEGVEFNRAEQIKRITKFRSRYTGAGVGYINVEEAKREVDKVVDAVISLLPDPKDKKWFRWSGYEPTEQIKDLYSKFESPDDFELTAYSEQTGISRVLKKVDKDDPPSLQPPESLEDLWKNWVKRENFFPGFLEQPPPKDIPIDPGKAEKLEVLEQEPRYTWNHVFLAGGWATKGPGAGSGNGLLFPKNWRGQTDGGGSGY